MRLEAEHQLDTASAAGMFRTFSGRGIASSFPQRAASSFAPLGTLDWRPQTLFTASGVSSVDLTIIQWEAISAYVRPDIDLGGQCTFCFWGLHGHAKFSMLAAHQRFAAVVGTNGTVASFQGKPKTKLRSFISATSTITLSNVTVATLPTAASHGIVAVTDGNASPNLSRRRHWRRINQKRRVLRRLVMDVALMTIENKLYRMPQRRLGWTAQRRWVTYEQDVIRDLKVIISVKQGDAQPVAVPIHKRALIPRVIIGRIGQDIRIRPNRKTREPRAALADVQRLTGERDGYQSPRHCAFDAEANALRAKSKP